MRIKRSARNRKRYVNGMSYNAIVQNYNIYTEDLRQITPERRTSFSEYKNTEAYLQHQLYHLLKLKNIECIPEFVDKGNRYDLLILHAGVPVCVVEIKNSRTAVNMAQLAAYELNSFGVPVYCLAGREFFVHTYNKILELCK